MLTYLYLHRMFEGDTYLYVFLSIQDDGSKSLLMLWSAASVHHWWTLHLGQLEDYLSSSTNCLSFGLFLLDCISYNTATRLRLDTCTCISLLSLPSYSYNFAWVLSIVHCKVSWTLLPCIVHFYVCECVLSTSMYPCILCILPFSDFTLLSMYYRLPPSVIRHSTF